MLGHNNLKDTLWTGFWGGGSIYEIKKIPRLDGKQQLDNLDVGVGTGVFSPTNNLR